jgi:hypothetical protein
MQYEAPHETMDNNMYYWLLLKGWMISCSGQMESSRRINGCVGIANEKEYQAVKYKDPVKERHVKFHLATLTGRCIIAIPCI